MMSNFALSLSFEGIKLLHRVPEGWDLVGETALEVPDLAAALAQLHADALLLEPDGMRTKLIIPPEQIKYLTLETAQTELGDVMAALDGATPYSVDELVVDFDRNGGRTYIAAVARETLEEARAFAAEHDFNPVCCAAVPQPYTFQGEVFFGPVPGATDVQSDRDSAPVRQTGVAVLPSTGEPDTSDAPPPLFTSRAKPASAATVVPAPANTADQEDLPEAPADAEVSFPRAKRVEPVRPVAAEHDPTPPVVAASAPSSDVKKPDTKADEAKPDAEPLVAPLRAEEVASSGGFISRRKVKSDDKKTDKKAAAIATKQAAPIRQKPRFLGLILTTTLLIFMAIVAIWASTLTEEELSSWFGFEPSSDIITVEEPPIPQVVAAAPQAEAPVVAAAPETPLEAVPLDQASPTPTVQLTASVRILSPAEANRIYAATGVWQRAPRFPLEPRGATLQATLPAAFAMPADPAPMDLPSLAFMQPDLPILPPINPPAPGTDFPRDQNGFILATPQGALTPSGAMVFAGPPPKKPPLRARAAAPLDEAPAGVVLVSGRPSQTPPARPDFEPLSSQEAPAEPALAALQPQEDYTRRPKSRPSDLVPAVIANADPELGQLRPKLRPNGLTPAAAPEPEEPATPDITDVVSAIAAAAPASPYSDMTANAVRNSSRPDTRPRNFARVVARAREAEAARAASRAATQPQTASAAPARASGPVPTTVARAATLDNAIRLRDINLIGIYGRPNDRRALVRLGNGRYVKVQVGSRLDGGRVAAIGDSELRYVKRGRSEVLTLPD